MISTNVNRSSHGLGTRKWILFFCKRRLARQMFFIVGNFSGRVICTFRMDLIIAKAFFFLIPETLQFELKSVRKGSHGRFVIVEALVQDSPVLLINIYAPNKTNEATDFYESLKTTLLDSDYDQDYKIIMGGDFNVPLSLQLDSYVEDKEIKCIAFADDLTNFIRDKESYASLSSLLNTYGQCSGLKLNQYKKEAYWLGSSYRKS